MKTNNMLPLGSIVSITGSPKKFMIIGRALYVNVQNEKKYFDYAACTYPEGIMDEHIVYLQAKDIQSVLFEGYTDEENERMVNLLTQLLEKHNITNQPE